MNPLTQRGFVLGARAGARPGQHCLEKALNPDDGKADETDDQGDHDDDDGASGVLVPAG
jgi:hypothetical protein